MTEPRPNTIRAALERLLDDLDEGRRLDGAVADADAALAAEPVGEGPAAWLYKGDPDFDGDTWGAKWCVTTDEHLARFKIRPDEPIPLFRRPAPPVPEPGEVGELVEFLQRHGAVQEAADTHWAKPLLRAATLLQQLSAPAPVVVPVAVADDRDPECVERWPECVPDGYDPRCCRFPKSCSCAYAIPLPQAGEGEA